MTRGTPLWFGPEHERTFGWLHVPPDARARGAVLLCPPLGYEQVCAHPAYHELAERLAAAGIAALRFDYHGTGDATGSSADPDRVGAAIRTIHNAREEVARHTTAPLSAIGMRAGALLASVAASERPFENLVLWDPAPSGRTFICELQLLQMVGVGVPDQPRTDGSLECAGVVYSAETVAALKALDMADVEGRLASRILVAARPGRELSRNVSMVLERGSDALGRIDAVGQEQLIDVVSALAVVPHESVGAIVDWLDGGAGRELYDVSSPSPTKCLSVVGRLADGRPIEETARVLGDPGLFAMTTEPEGGGQGPWIIGVSSGAGNHVGPSRLWVDLARDLAARGGRFARIDLSGLGDSGSRPGQQRQRVYAPESFEDITRVAAELQPDDPHDVVLVGLCSGGYHAVDVGAVFGVRAIYALNPPLDYIPPDVVGDSATPRAAPRARRFARAFSGSAVRGRLGAALPPIVWTALDRVGLFASPARGLRNLVARGVSTVLIYGADDEGYVKLRRRARSDLRVLEQSPRFRLSTVPGMDHAMMLSEQRSEVASQLVEQIAAEHIAGTADTR